MATVKNFLYCQGVDNTGSRIDVKGLMSAISPDRVPCKLSFTVDFALLDLSEGEHSVVLKVTAPDKEVLLTTADIKVTFRRERNNNLPQKYAGVNVAVNLKNLNVQSSGIYSTQVRVDGADLGSYGIYIRGQNETGIGEDDSESKPAVLDKPKKHRFGL